MEGFVDQVLAHGQPILRVAIVLAAAIVIGFILHAIAFAVLKRFARRTRAELDDAIAKRCRGPLRLLIVLLVIEALFPLMQLPEVYGAFAAHVIGILLIVSGAWLVIAFTAVGQDVIRSRYDIAQADNLHARKVHTQYEIARKIVIALTWLLALAFILMTFETVRSLGRGLLASAGIIGIIVGFAAQKSLGTLFAGIQIAITEPIRIDDVVIVEGEWGRIEEINLTYVVVRIWDQRRLIVPITYFLEKPFQNWTRVSAELLGTIYLYVDHSVPVDAIRTELQRIVKDDDRWDGRVASIQITDVTERAVQMRALISARDSGAAWDLRCLVREKLVAFVREQYPQSLPRLRAELTPLSEGQHASST